MYCRNCGAELKEAANFCPVCGGQVSPETSNNESGNQSPGKIPVPNVQTAAANHVEKEKVWMVISIVLSAMCIFLYVTTFFECYESNMNAFDWLSDASGFLGQVTYAGIPLWLIGYMVNMLIHIFSQRRKNMMKAFSDVMCIFLICIVIHIFGFVFDDWSFGNDVQIILYRVFNRTYHMITGKAVVLSLCSTVSAVIALKYEEKKKAM